MDRRIDSALDGTLDNSNVGCRRSMVLQSVLFTYRAQQRAAGLADGWLGMADSAHDESHSHKHAVDGNH